MSKTKQPSLIEMLESGVHFGHQTSRWHPKMEEFIFGARSGVHIIDLEKTQTQLANALSYIQGVAERGGTVMFVGTKKQAQDIVKKYAEECGMPYVIHRWLGGTLTNFGQIKHSLKRLKNLKEQRDKGELRKYTKKEQLLLSREIEDLEKKVGGIQDVTTVPDAMFVIDVRNEKTAVKEAKRTGVNVIALCDTNVNPKKIDYVIPANDDAVKSIELMTSLVASVIKEGASKVGVASLKKESIKEAAKKKIKSDEEGK
jgi:small subunit ribosomal protein S2